MPTNGPETRQIHPTERTGIEEVDEFLRSLVNIFQIAVGQSLRSVYLIGSYACGAPAPDSDLDCCFIWAEGTDRSEIYKGSALEQHVNRISQHTVDPLYNATETPFYDPDSHEDTTVGYPCGPVLKLSVRDHSLLLWGQDIRPRIRAACGRAMLNDVLVAPLNWIRQTHFGSMDAAIVPPLAEPSAEGEDLGFGDLHKVGIRVLHIARALVFLETGEFLFDKRHVPSAYEEHVGGRWAGMIADVFNARQGNVPPEKAHAVHRSACRQLTAFENYFLETLTAKGIEVKP